MEYKNLGNAGLKVSSLCLGTMTFGDGADEEMAKALYEVARDQGINFFDCANLYAKGESEKILGRLIHHHREEVVISSKVYFPTGDGVNDRGLGRTHIIRELDKSLKRLRTDYIDIYYLHHFDEQTPLEETLSTLNDMVRAGKINYIGISNFSAWQTMKAIAITQQHNFAPITCIQPMYSLVKRQCESELLPLAISEKLGVTPYSPLGAGLLTGKYQEKAIEGRLNVNQQYQRRYELERRNKTVDQFIAFAKENNYNPVSLAIAWVAAHPAVTTPLIGARSVEQLQPALASVAINMTQELREELSALSIAPVLATDRAEEV